MSLSDFIQLIEKWETTTDVANQLFEKGHHLLAIPFYEKSLFFSECMFRNAEHADKLGIHVISPFSVSCINMANNFRASGDVENAEPYFMYNVWQLKMLSKKEGITDSLYWDCVHNWEKAVRQLTVFHQEIHQPLSINFWEDDTYEKIQNAKEILSMQNATMN